MSLRCETPCDFGPCPYNAEQHGQCEYWCGDPRPEDEMGLWGDYDDDLFPADEVLGWDE